MIDQTQYAYTIKLYAGQQVTFKEELVIDNTATDATAQPQFYWQMPNFDLTTTSCLQ